MLNPRNNQNDYNEINPEMFPEARGTRMGANGAPVNNGLAFGGPAVNLASYTAKTFGWMFLGLLVTFGVAMAFLLSGAWQVMFRIAALPFILLIAEVIVVVALSARLHKLSIGAARGLFFVYAALNGVTFASFFLMYDVVSVVYVFGLTALFFGALAAYGYFTKKDLSGLRGILIAGVIFLAVFWLISMFLPISGMERIVCFIGLAIFMGFTAYDTQKIKTCYQMYGGNEEMAAKASIICALQLYLDFINLFIYLLRLVGRRSNS